MPRPDSAIEIMCLSPKLTEDAGSCVAALPHPAMDDELTGGQFRQPLAQFVDRDIDCPWNGGGDVLGLRTDVNQLRTFSDQTREFMPLDGCCHSSAQVVRDETEHVDRILGRSKLRRIRQFEIG